MRIRFLVIFSCAAVVSAACTAETPVADAGSQPTTVTSTAAALPSMADLAAAVKRGHKSAKISVSHWNNRHHVEGKGHFLDAPDGDRVSLMVGDGAKTSELRMIGSSGYVGVSEEARQQEPEYRARPWVAIEPGKTDDFTAAWGPAVVQLNRQADPVEFIEDIASSGKVTLVTDEAHPQSKSGVTHYLIDLDVQTLIDESADPRRTAELKELLGKGNKVRKVDVLLDRAGLPVETRYENTTVTYSDWDTPVDIRQPPADQVTYIT